MHLGTCRHRLPSLAFLALALLTCPSAAAAEKINWRSAVEARQDLDGLVGVNWPANPLRDSVARLSQVRRVAIWLDRRIDPDQTVQFKVKDVPLREALKELADQLKAGVCLVGPVVYIGPKPTAAKLTSIAAQRREEAAKLPEEARRRLTRTLAWQWEELAAPRDLLETLAAEGGFKLADSGPIPHDLWPAGDWPALSLCDRLSLVLAGFDQTYEFTPDGAALQIVPFPNAVKIAAVERTHAVKGDFGQFAERIAALFPAAKIRAEQGRVVVTASAEEHLQIAQIAKGGAAVRPPPAGAQKRYTLKLDNQPVGGAVKAIAKQVELELKLAPNLTAERLNQKVSFQVKEVTLDELLNALFKPAGLSYKHDGKTLEVFEKEQ